MKTTIAITVCAAIRYVWKFGNKAVSQARLAIYDSRLRLLYAWGISLEVNFQTLYRWQYRKLCLRYAGE